MKLKIGATTDVGQVRTSNEDSFLVDERLGLFAVADGMGGHSAGEVASFTALEALRAAIASQKNLEQAIAVANEAVYEKASQDESLEGMGTTMTAFTLGPDGTPIVGQVGDSRAYLLRDGQLSQLTQDHSLVEELVQEGTITQEQADVHPQRAIITRALGIEPTVEVDVFSTPVRTGDRLLLCSDGLTSMIRPEQISRILQLEEDPAHAAESLVDAANEAGGEDNVTAVVIDIVDGSSSPITIQDGDAPPDGNAPVAATPAPPITNIPPTTKPPKKKKHFTKRAFRFLFVMLPILVVIGLGVGAVGWYARNTFYVDFNTKGNVIVYRGRPGGLLGWNPTIESQTKLTRDDLTTSERIAVSNQPSFSSRNEAISYIDQLTKQVNKQRAASTTTSTTTTTLITTTTPPPAPAAPPST